MNDPEKEVGERKMPHLNHAGGVPEAPLVSQLLGLIEGCVVQCSFSPEMN